MAQRQVSQQLSEETALSLLSTIMVDNASQQHHQQQQQEPQQQEQTDSARVSVETDRIESAGYTDGVIGTKPQPTSSQLERSSQESMRLTDEFGNSCRICRCNRSDMEIISCPCNCTGSVGYIHLMCLKRWIMHRRDNRCEVCNSLYNIREERASFMQMVRSFFCRRCCGRIVKHLLLSASVVPLAHTILQQVMRCMDNLNQGSSEQLTVQEVFVASCAMIITVALFFHFFEFATTRFLLVRNILHHWWMFGSTNDFGLVELDDDTFDLF